MERRAIFVDWKTQRQVIPIDLQTQCTTSSVNLDKLILKFFRNGKGLPNVVGEGGGTCFINCFCTIKLREQGRVVSAQGRSVGGKQSPEAEMYN